MKRFIAVLAALMILPVFSGIAAEPVKLIFDTDIAGDCDDVGAVAVLHALAEYGEVEILATVVSDRNPNSVLALDAANTWYGRGHIPIGTTKDENAAHNDAGYAKALADEYPRTHDWQSGADAPDAVAIMRQALAAQPDIDDENPGVVLVGVGFQTNFSNLLKSGPCPDSPLDGVQLVEKKVRLWLSMAGTFPSGREYNIHRHTSAAKHAFENWPTPIIFSGFEIGREIFTGQGLVAEPHDHIVRRAYELLSWRNALSGHYSWDQATTLYAVRAIDDGPAADYWTLSNPGTIQIADDGSNTWKDDPNGNQRYKIANKDRDAIAREIEDMMVRPPVSGDTPARFLVAASASMPETGSEVTVTARLTDAEGRRVMEAGRVVNWTASNGGRFSASQTETDHQGRATVTFTVSPEALVEHVITATDDGDTAIIGESPAITAMSKEPVGLIAHYCFDEREGDTVADQSGFGDPLDLQIIGGAQWIAGKDAILLDGASGHLMSKAAARKLYSRMILTGQFTIEVRFAATEAVQGGPARIVSYSGGSSSRNFTLGHGHWEESNNNMAVRLRTTETDSNGMPQLDVVGALDTELQHVVATYDGSMLRVYRNGIEVFQEERGGSLENWDSGFYLLLGAEADGRGYWAGALHEVSIYDRALSAAEVAERYQNHP